MALQWVALKVWDCNHSSRTLDGPFADHDYKSMSAFVDEFPLKALGKEVGKEIENKIKDMSENLSPRSNLPDGHDPCTGPRSCNDHSQEYSTDLYREHNYSQNPVENNNQRFANSHLGRHDRFNGESDDIHQSTGPYGHNTRRNNFPNYEDAIFGPNHQNQSRREQYSHSHHQSYIKLPGYTGKERWDIWHNRFLEVARLRGWDDEQKLMELIPRLQGTAGDFVYGQLSSATRQNYHL